MLSARSHGVRRAVQRPGVPWWTQNRGSWQWLGPGNTNPMVSGGWEGGTRYSTLPLPPCPHHPWYTPPRRTTPPTVHHTSTGCTKQLFQVDPRRS